MTDVLEQRKDATRRWFEELRERICTEFERIEDELTAPPSPQVKGLAPGRFARTPWQRAGGGGGTMALMKGRVFEKVGVNVSTVHGEFAEAFRKEIPGADRDPRFWASGISLVAHLQSPRVPAAHMNTRFIVTSKAWFGGGADLTPMTPVDEDTRDFHAALEAACARHDPAYYPRFKQWCDEYFFLKHRNEPRGIGGLFFDDLNERGFDHCFGFMKSVGDHFLPAYLPIVQRRKHLAYGSRERDFQLYRRGRYVEFNLVYDRGTLFGLQSGGRIESILMSLPPLVKWRYNWRPEPGSPEARFYEVFLRPRAWLPQEP